MVGALFPCGGVANFWRTQKAAAVARVTVLGDDIIGGFRAAAAGCHGNFHALAFLALDANLAHRLQALGNVIIGRSLSADSP